MSEDESEDEERNSAVATRYKRVRPVWRGLELERTPRMLDESTAICERSNIGRRTRKPSSKAPIREDSNLTYEGKVPKGLYRNWYDSKYYRSLRDWELQKLTARSQRYRYTVSALVFFQFPVRQLISLVWIMLIPDYLLWSQGANAEGLTSSRNTSAGPSESAPPAGGQDGGPQNAPPAPSGLDPTEELVSQRTASSGSQRSLELRVRI